jgi:hypothetical protein
MSRRQRRRRQIDGHLAQRQRRQLPGHGQQQQWPHEHRGGGPDGAVSSRAAGEGRRRPGHRADDAAGARPP